MSNYGQDKQKHLYQKAFKEQCQMLSGNSKIDFKRAVFVTEDAFFGGTLNYNSFKNDVANIGLELKNLIKKKGLSKYKTAGNWAVFTYMIDTLPVNNYNPYSYDFEDFMGDDDWTKMFVTKLMKTKSGNCHSLPYFYKILSEELGVSAHLALAPNHIYIKHIDEKGEWVNIELTNGGFPRDQWIIKQMDISVEAIKNEVYMKPLTQKESIAMTMFDLANGYEFQFGIDAFYLSIIDTALMHFPNCIPLLMNKANFYAKTGMKEQKKIKSNSSILKEMYDKQENIIQQISELGYKEMTLEQYQEWVKSVELEKQKRNLKE